jgi:hypothetical protein
LSNVPIETANRLAESGNIQAMMNKKRSIDRLKTPPYHR